MLGKIVFFLVFVLFAPFGIGHLWHGLNDAMEASQSATWPTTTGKIVSSTVVKSGGNRGTSYKPAITYAYTVAGQNYSGTTISPGRYWVSASAYQAVHQFPVGSNPTIFYSPSDPAKSVLVAGLRGINFGTTVMGLLICTFASVFGVVGFGALRGKTDRSGAMVMAPGSVSSRLALFLTLAVFAEVGLLIYLR